MHLPQAKLNSVLDRFHEVEARMAAANDKQVPTYHNLIAGDPDQIAQILVQHPEFFEAEPYLIIVRDGPMNAGVQP